MVIAPSKKGTKNTTNSLFRQTMDETSYLIASEVLKYLPLEKTTVLTPPERIA